MKKFFLIGVMLSALFLTGCGEGWETKIYDGFPYGNVRTAGYGVEYVREHLMPKKGTKIEIEKPAPVKEENKMDAGKVLSSGEKFFRDLQRK